MSDSIVLVELCMSCLEKMQAGLTKPLRNATNPSVTTGRKNMTADPRSSGPGSPAWSTSSSSRDVGPGRPSSTEDGDPDYPAPRPPSLAGGVRQIRGFRRRIQPAHPEALEACPERSRKGVSGIPFSTGG